jgi:hypothetical protein
VTLLVAVCLMLKPPYGDPTRIRIFIIIIIKIKDVDYLTHDILSIFIQLVIEEANCSIHRL